MKKSNLFYLMAAGSLLFGSCSSEKDLPAPGNGDDAGKQIITLSVASDANKTRAGRPLLSSEAAQDIDFVTLIVTNAKENDKIVWTKTIENWNGNSTEADAIPGSTVYSHGGVEYGRSTKIEILKTEVDFSKTEAEYNIFAIGYSDNSDYDLTPILNATSLSSDVAISIKPDKAATVWAEEIFAGALEKVKGTQTGLDQKELILHRQVAGTIGYMNEIPYVEKTISENQVEVGRYLHLVASNFTDQLILGHFTEEGDHAHNPGNLTKGFTINGYKKGKTYAEQNAADEKILYTIDLKDWFTNLKETYDENEVPQGLLDKSEWKNNSAYKNYSFVKGSVFAATFIHPFRKVADNATFTLYLSTSATEFDADHALRTWKVTLPSTTYTVSFPQLDATEGISWVTRENLTESGTVYGVLRNHLYSLGVKNKAVKKDNPEDPDPEDEDEEDDPEPLNNKQELVVKVNSNWEVIHKMHLE